MPRTDEMIEFDAFLRHFVECGGTDEPYLRVHYPRFVRTQQRFLGDGNLKTGAILDVGAHWLHQSLLYALKGFDVTALDAVETFRDPHVRQIGDRHGIALLPEPDLASAQALAALPDDTFDVVLFTEIIEHLTFNPVAMWRQIHRVMKPGAQLIVTTPNYYALRGRAWHWLRFLRGGGSGLRVDAILGEPTFAHHWKEYSLAELRQYFHAVSPDFECVTAKHTEKYGPSRRRRLLDLPARLVERCIPPLRPGLYLQLKLATKHHGVRPTLDREPPLPSAVSLVQDANTFHGRSAVASPDHAPAVATPAQHEGIRAAHPNGHFYSPVVDPSAVNRERVWPEHPEVLGIEFNDASHQDVLSRAFPRFLPDYDYPEILEETDTLSAFYTRNSQFSWLDARALFVLLRLWKPQRLIEVGSGFSTLLAADVNRRFLEQQMHITCIEPYPRGFLRNNESENLRLIESKVQDVALSEFLALGAGDILFIDSSHVCKTDSDVNFLFFEVLPRLALGVRVHIHDIFLPQDYKPEWVIDENRSWNEQYLLRALLMNSSAWRVLFGCNYACMAFPDLLRSALGHHRGVIYGGGSFWIEKT